MKRELLEYFSSLENLKNPKDGLIHTDSVSLDLITPRNGLKKVPKYNMSGKPVYIKGYNGDNTIVGLSTTQMYQEIGLTTPTQYILTTSPSHRKLFSRVKAVDFRFTSLSTVTPDLYNIPDIDCATLGSILPADTKLSAAFRIGKYAWQFLYDASIRSIMLEYMTPECFNEIIGEALVAEIRTDIDRHFENTFLYKRKGAKKYEGVIPIDLDNLEILRHIYGNKFSEWDFEGFLATPYEATSVTGQLNKGAYIHRVSDLKEIIDDGVVPPTSLEYLRSALKHDLPDTIESQCNPPSFSKRKKPLISAYKRLWDYNREELGPLLDI